MADREMRKNRMWNWNNLSHTTAIEMTHLAFLRALGRTGRKTYSRYYHYLETDWLKSRDLWFAIFSSLRRLIIRCLWSQKKNCGDIVLNCFLSQTTCKDDNVTHNLSARGKVVLEHHTPSAEAFCFSTEGMFWHFPACCVEFVLAIAAWVWKEGLAHFAHFWSTDAYVHYFFDKISKHVSVTKYLTYIHALKHLLQTASVRALFWKCTSYSYLKVHATTRGQGAVRMVYSGSLL